jgi:hypothetical protein
MFSFFSECTKQFRFNDDNHDNNNRAAAQTAVYQERPEASCHFLKLSACQAGRVTEKNPVATVQAFIRCVDVNRYLGNQSNLFSKQQKDES